VSEPQQEQTIQFKLRADRIGTGMVRIYAFCEGASVAVLPLKVDIVSESGEALPAADQREKVTVDAAPRRAPDLSLFIFEDGRELSFRLSSADGKYHMQTFGEVVLKSAPA